MRQSVPTPGPQARFVHFAIVVSGPGSMNKPIRKVSLLVLVVGGVWEAIMKKVYLSYTNKKFTVYATISHYFSIYRQLIEYTRLVYNIDRLQ